MFKIAIDMRLRNNLQVDRHDEYRQVQAAKLTHRMAGGAHKCREHERPDGSVEVSVLHKYPVSRGQMLRVMRRKLEMVKNHLNEAIT